MSRLMGKLWMVLLAAGCLAGPSFARDDPPPGTAVLMTASCSGSDVVLAIDFTVTQAPPSQFVGWVVAREVLGPCVADAWVTDVMPWPTLGTIHLDLTVIPDLPGWDAIYRIWAVDADGNETFIYWPQRHNFAHADCLPGPSTVGRFVDYAGNLYFEACEDWCWPTLSPFDGSYPAGAEDLIDTGQVMALFGTLYMGMEGTYIIATGMAPSMLPCDPVSLDPTTWGGLKANYR